MTRNLLLSAKEQQNFHTEEKSFLSVTQITQRSRKTSTTTINHIKHIQDNLRDDEKPEKTLFVITTDGMENSSHEFKYSMIKDLINEIVQQILYSNQKHFLKMLILFNYSELKQSIKNEELKKIIELNDNILLNNIIKNWNIEQTKKLKRKNHSLKKALNKSLQEQKEQPPFQKSLPKYYVNVVS